MLRKENGLCNLDIFAMLEFLNILLLIRLIQLRVRQCGIIREYVELGVKILKGDQCIFRISLVFDSVRP